MLRLIGWLCLCLVWSPLSVAESDHGETSSSRPYGESGLASPTRTLVQSLFSLSKEVIDSVSGPLDRAARRADDGKGEEDIARELARLFTSLNATQLRDLAERVETGGDDGALKQRLLWAAKIIADLDDLEGFDAIEEPSEPFAAAFRKALGPVQEEKEAFFALIEKANQGDEAAKAQLRDSKKYPDLAGFLRGQLRSGNAALAGDIAKALGEKNQGGEHSLDLVSGDGKPARLILGKEDDDVRQALRNFELDRLEDGGSHGGFEKFKLASERHTNQTLSSGGFTIRPRLSPSEEGTPTPEVPSSDTGGREPLPVRPPPLVTKALDRLSTDELDEAVATFARRNGCVGCHGPDSKYNLPFFDKDGRLLERAGNKRTRILNVLAGHGVAKNGKMKGVLARLNLSRLEKGVLGRWGHAHGVAEDKNPFLKEAGLEEGHGAEEPSAERPGSPSGTPEGPKEEPKVEEKPLKDIEEARERNLFRDLVEPAELARLVREAKADPKKKTFRLWSLGVVDPPIHGSEVIGGVFDDEPFKGLDALEAGPNAPSKDEEIIIYCGCCALEFCPNVLAALPKLKERGYTNIRVLNLEEDFWNDWESKFDLEGNPQPAEK